MFLNKHHSMKVRFILVALSFLMFNDLWSQNTSQETSFWQKPWEGVPEHYQKWNFPDYQFPSKLSEWKNERTKVRATLEKLIGDIPPRPVKLTVKIISREEKDGYILEKFVFDNEVDSWVPGYFAYPVDAKGKVPVVLALHGHSSNKDNVFAPDSANQRQGIINQGVAPILLKNGFAVMAIDSYFNGERRGEGPAGKMEMQENNNQEMSLFKLNLWFGRSLWGMQLRDEQMALDYLVTRPEIDSNRIGVEGMSMGSTRAWWLAALDNRVKAVVGVACFTRYKELIQQRKLKWHDIYYFVPGMLNHFDTEAVMGLIAPRPFLVLTGDIDDGSPLSGIKVLEKKLDTVYSLYNKGENFKSIVYPNTGHVYTWQMKMEMLGWFEKYLK
jgi:dienelactone hydrolase